MWFRERKAAADPATVCGPPGDAPLAMTPGAAGSPVASLLTQAPFLLGQAPFGNTVFLDFPPRCSLQEMESSGSDSFLRWRRGIPPSVKAGCAVVFFLDQLRKCPLIWGRGGVGAPGQQCSGSHRVSATGGVFSESWPETLFLHCSFELELLVGMGRTETQAHVDPTRPEFYVSSFSAKTHSWNVETLGIWLY